MPKSNIHILIQSLDQRELASFHSFLEWQVSVNERHKKSLPLMKNLLKSYSAKKITIAESKQAVNTPPRWGGVRGGAKEKRYLESDLSVYLQTFLVYRNAFTNDATYRMLLMKELFKRKAIKPLITLYKDNKAKQQNLRGHENGFLALHDAEKKYYETILNDGRRNIVPDFDAIANYLDAHFVLHKLKLLCETVNYSNIMATKFNQSFATEIIKEVESGRFNDAGAIVIYYHVLMTLTKPDDEKYFDELNKAIKKHNEQFDSAELMELYHYQKNYCAKKINAGKLSYRKELISIYKEMIAHPFLFRKQWMSQWDYKNAVTVALREKEYAWAKNFIEKYNSFLIAPERKNAYRFNLAAYHFAKKEFKEARKTLQYINMDDVFYRLDARLMMLKIYFELNDTDGLYYHINAFKKFLYRNRQVSDYQKTIYTNLIKSVNKLIAAFNNRSLLKKLSSEFKTAKDIADVQWLTEKVEELI